ncbi:MAG TPA: Wzz/FepE/Etk N-terminal domain-containing protein [Terriglobia bacterium]|nr:Wzz/FepE/Etk N-terminal domain-containing protein [Terriglobia bacterium]
MGDQGLMIPEAEQTFRIPNQTLGPTLRDIVAAGFRHRRLLIVAFAGVFLGVIIFGLLFTQYEAEMKILVRRERQDPVVTPAAEGVTQSLSAPNVSEEELNSEVELLKSRDLLEKVVTACGLHQSDKASFWSNLTSWLQDERLAIPKATRRLEKKLQIDVMKKTNLIAVTYKSRDPELAARVLTTLADLYLEKHLAVHRPPGAFDFFQKQADQYKKDLAAAEARLAKFDSEQDVAAAVLERDTAVQKLAEFEATARETRSAIAETEQRIRTLQAQMAASAPRMTTQVRTNSTLLQGLKSTLLTLELRRSELLAKFEPSYRPVQEVATQIAQTRAAIAEAEKSPPTDETTDRDPTYEWLRGELAKATADLTALKARASVTARNINAYREDARKADQKALLQQDLLRTAKAQEESYLLYLRKKEEARISDALDQKRIVNVVIAEAATVPALPVYSAWWYVLIGGLLGSMASIGSVMISERLDPTFRTPDEVETVLNMPVLASFPKRELPG